MRFGSIIFSMLVILATFAIIVGETNIDLAAATGSMPPPLGLLVSGLALVAVGARIRKWLGRTQAREP
jgi:hypothetical protein